MIFSFYVFMIYQLTIKAYQSLLGIIILVISTFSTSRCCFWVFILIELLPKIKNFSLILYYTKQDYFLFFWYFDICPFHMLFLRLFLLQISFFTDFLLFLLKLLDYLIFSLPLWYQFFLTIYFYLTDNSPFLHEQKVNNFQLIRIVPVQKNLSNHGQNKEIIECTVKIFNHFNQFTFQSTFIAFLSSS